MDDQCFLQLEFKSLDEEYANLKVCISLLLLISDLMMVIQNMVMEKMVGINYDYKSGDDYDSQVWSMPLYSGFVVIAEIESQFAAFIIILVV